MKIISWNVAGLRARIKQEYLNFLIDSDIDIICFQEIKCTSSQVIIPKNLDNEFMYKFWNSNPGITQRAGFSGTAIWCKEEPIKQLETPEFDTEGRITSLEFKDFFLVNVYTPNSQELNSERCNYRINIWDPAFRKYINNLKTSKNTIICGDFNVAHENIDFYNPIKYKNKVAGFLDCERKEFSQHLESGFIDGLRYFHKEKELYTYWNQRFPHMRKTNKGWRIDYFLINKEFIKEIKDCNIHPEIRGSDHCPISIELFN